MNGIVINIDPVIFHFGGFELRWYSLAIIVGIVVATLLAVREAKRKGIEADQIYSLALWVVVGGVVGARLFHVIDQWSYYASNPAQILQFQRGGLAIWGAVAGGMIATVVFSKMKSLSLGRLVDAMTPGLLTAQIIGRFGCIVNGDAYGGLTNLPWAFIYIHPGALIPERLFGQPTHPYPLYEIIWNGLALLLIWRLRGVFKQDGLLFLSYLPVYALGRFLLTFVREENITLWGMQQAQVVALLILIISIAVLVYRLRRPAAVPVAAQKEADSNS
ncbi:MAG: prolipoprotein diacylglyceryl transferase [Chloroflexi bacterium]|nr:prolipoprotein diacylglyceryl transferase [Chloroflexota bacterium]